MLGNVLEWTASPWQQWQQWQEDFTQESTATLSYTYFGDRTNELFCGARYHFYPFYWSSGDGFRVVLSLAFIE